MTSLFAKVVLLQVFGSHQGEFPALGMAFIFEFHGCELGASIRANVLDVPKGKLWLTLSVIWLEHP